MQFISLFPASLSNLHWSFKASYHSDSVSCGLAESKFLKSLEKLQLYVSKLDKINMKYIYSEAYSLFSLNMLTHFWGIDNASANSKALNIYISNTMNI